MHVVRTGSYAVGHAVLCYEGEPGRVVCREAAAAEAKADAAASELHKAQTKLDSLLQRQIEVQAALHELQQQKQQPTATNANDTQPTTGNTSTELQSQEQPVHSAGQHNRGHAPASLAGHNNKCQEVAVATERSDAARSVSTAGIYGAGAAARAAGIPTAEQQSITTTPTHTASCPPAQDKVASGMHDAAATDDCVGKDNDNAAPYDSSGMQSITAPSSGLLVHARKLSAAEHATPFTATRIAAVLPTVGNSDGSAHAIQRRSTRRSAAHSSKRTALRRRSRKGLHTAHRARSTDADPTSDAEEDADMPECGADDAGTVRLTEAQWEAWAEELAEEERELQVGTLGILATS